MALEPITERKAAKLKARTKAREKAWQISRRLVHEDDLQRRAKSWIGRVVTLSERHLRILEDKKPEHFDLKDFETLTRITETVDRVARRSLSLDLPQGGGNQTITLQVQSELPAQRQLEGNVVEVETVSSVPKQDTESASLTK